MHFAAFDRLTSWLMALSSLIVCSSFQFVCYPLRPHSNAFCTTPRTTYWRPQYDQLFSLHMYIFPKHFESKCLINILSQHMEKLLKQLRHLKGWQMRSKNHTRLNMPSNNLIPCLTSFTAFHLMTIINVVYQEMSKKLYRVPLEILMTGFIVQTHSTISFPIMDHWNWSLSRFPLYSFIFVFDDKYLTLLYWFHCRLS